MADTGVCCANLEEPNTLMKMGLSMVLIGHVNFLLGALVHGVVLRHINLHKQARAMEYAISNVFALTSGLVGIVVGILAIVLSKNKKSRCLTWSLFTVALAASLMAAASAIGLSVSVVRAAIHGGRSLLTHCRFPDAIGYSSITNECPFDPTRIYSTTMILWVPLIVTCVIQLVFCARCSAVCVSFLGLPCCPNRKRNRNYGRAINVVRPMLEAAPSRHTESPRSYDEPPTRHTEPPRSYDETPTRSYREPPRRNTEPPRQQRRPPPPPQHLPLQHRSLPPSERRPLRPPYRERSGRERHETSVGSQQRAPEQHQLLERGTMERSSFWI
ncbi:transmembrane protein 54-like isoform X1 [Sebastes umbrosus]|uniref:transmembrane protein 54-like isoform X1 n=1 Tax=Sebastes umbrosus TaxID=72105 RepID=UPI00189D0BBC|nr:transmembrane protein 54-like isoform X1 [Sebastes umbrosus]